MKVICIDAKPGVDGDYPGNPLEINEGEHYTVIDETVVVSFSGHSYTVVELSEFPNGYYKKSRFIPISDIDETEMIREQLQTSTPC